jgi:DnaJ-class molecular chaperone
MNDVIGLMLDPEKYGYTQCPHCNGYGSSLKESAPTCTLCGGSGLIKKPELPGSQL